MTRVYLSLGSNIDRDHHISAALDALADRFGELQLSRVYESEAVGFEGDCFYNLIVGIDTELGVGALTTALRAIEDGNGRRRDGPRFGARTLDIDILAHGQSVGIIEGTPLPRPEILAHAFVLRPLADIAADDEHPVTHQTYGQLWANFDPTGPQLWPIDFTWRGRRISRAD